MSTSVWIHHWRSFLHQRLDQTPEIQQKIAAICWDGFKSNLGNFKMGWLAESSNIISIIHLFLDFLIRPRSFRSFRSCSRSLQGDINGCRWFCLWVEISGNLAKVSAKPKPLHKFDSGLKSASTFHEFQPLALSKTSHPFSGFSVRRARSLLNPVWDWLQDVSQAAWHAWLSLGAPGSKGCSYHQPSRAQPIPEWPGTILGLAGDEGASESSENSHRSEGVWKHFTSLVAKKYDLPIFDHWIWTTFSGISKHIYGYLGSMMNMIWTCWLLTTDEVSQPDAARAHSEGVLLLEVPRRIPGVVASENCLRF